jgi:hypothetical protein
LELRCLRLTQDGVYEARVIHFPKEFGLRRRCPELAEGSAATPKSPDFDLGNTPYNIHLWTGQQPSFRYSVESFT